MSKEKPQVGVIMGSVNDLEVMKAASEVLDELGVANEVGIKSAHRTPDAMRDYALRASDRELEVIIAGAGGSAHLPGMVASYTRLPVIGVPVEVKSPLRESSLWSMLDMPDGTPLATVGINKARNAGLLAARILAIHNPELAAALDKMHSRSNAEVMLQDEELMTDGLAVFLRNRRLAEETRSSG